jgi:iron(III) transport system ATP-binding protein
VAIGGRVVTSVEGNGSDVFVPPERRRVGMVFQDWALFPHLSVAANVGYGLPRRPDRRNRIEQALAMVGMSGLGDRNPTTLSGGQQQRVALARAIAPEPAVILLDEPFSNLDTALRVQVRGEVHRLLSELGITTVFVTHDQEEAFVLGDEVGVMHEGRMIQQATPSELYARPADPWVAGFVGDANLVDGETSGERADTVVGPVPLAAALPVDGPAQVLVRPEELGIGPGDSATVEVLEFYGHDSVYVVRPDRGAPLRIRIGSLPSFRPGDRVEVSYVGAPTVAYAADRRRTDEPAVTARVSRV